MQYAICNMQFDIPKTRLKITSVLTRVHVSICTQYKAQNRNAACRPTAVRKACNSAGLQPVIKTFLQGFRARLPGKAAG
jgi:hypothetical protein